MELDAPTLEALEPEHGDSFYVVDLDAFEANYHEFLGAFRALYPATTVAYSYKTNYTPRLCELVQRWGGYAEVVSRMEYELARRIGVPPERIVFNGPLKTADDLACVLQAGSIANLDSPYQLQALSAIAGHTLDHPPIRVGLRVTFPFPGGEQSRFGFDPDELPAILGRLRALPGVEVGGLHCHFLTPARSAADYRSIVHRMLTIAREHLGDGELRFLNLGGGYLSKMADELREQLGLAVPTYREYAEAIAVPVAAAFPDGTGPELVLEPGIGLTANAACFVTRVIDVRVLGSRRLALASGSIYDIKPTLHKRNLPMHTVPHPRAGRRRTEGRIDVVGSSCMEHDVLFAGFEGSLAVGDRLVFENVGAYTNVLRPPFIRGCPPILGWSRASGGFETLKRKEELDDTLRTYVFAEADGARS